MKPGPSAVPGRISAIRIVARKFATSAFSGNGARLYGGRWNSPGTSMVYTAGSLSLAILEWRVHLAQWPAPAMSVIVADIDQSLIWIPPRLPAHWKQMPAPRAAAAFGDDWINSNRSAVMRVPSAVVPNEWNYLVNPAHPAFSKLSLGKAHILKSDPRLGPLNKS